MKTTQPETRLPFHALPILILGLVTVIYTWPLLSRLTVAVPGRFELTDTTETVWSIGWMHAALSQGGDIWHTDRLFYPFGADLRFNVFGSLQGLMAFPFVALLGVVGASNLVIILTMFLNGVFAYLLVWKHTDHETAALLASTCHILSLVVVWHFSAGRNALPAVWVVSASLLFLRSLLKSPSAWNGFLFGSSLILALFTDLQVALFACMWALLYAVAYFSGDGIKLLRPLIVPFLIAITMFTVASAVVLSPAISLMNQVGFPVPTLDNVAFYAFPISDFVSPARIPFIYGFDFLLFAILAVVLFRWRGVYRFWLVGSLIFLLLSLGPYLKPTQLPLPYALASLWPPLLNFRAVYRFAIPATLGLTLVTGYALASLLPRTPIKGVAFLACMVFICLRLAYTIHVQPFETQVYPEYAFYSDIARDTEDYVILEIPFGIRSGFDQIGQGGERLQYYQAIHGKKILNGSLARLPSSLFDFYRTHPLLLFFSGDPSVDRSRLGEDFLDVLTWTKARYILVHGSLLTFEQAFEIESFLAGQERVTRIGVEDDLVIYRVTP